MEPAGRVAFVRPALVVWAGLGTIWEVPLIQWLGANSRRNGTMSTFGALQPPATNQLVLGIWGYCRLADLRSEVCPTGQGRIPPGKRRSIEMGFRRRSVAAWSPPLPHRHA